jgi:hypothetical protein
VVSSIDMMITVEAAAIPSAPSVALTATSLRLGEFSIPFGESFDLRWSAFSGRADPETVFKVRNAQRTATLYNNATITDDISFYRTSDAILPAAILRKHTGFAENSISFLRA